MTDPRLPGATASLGSLEALEGTHTDLLDFALLDDTLQEVADLGILDVPAESLEAAHAGEANRVRDAVISERLWLLGYLHRPEMQVTSDHPGERNEVLEAVRAFQEDADLKVDGWVGPKTWKALQELVAFETPTAVARYARAGTPLPALARAVRLRLWALGLLDEQPDGFPESETVPEYGLSRFVMLLRRFHALPFDATMPALMEQIRLLFDMDTVMKAVARSASQRPVDGRLRWVFGYVKDRHEAREPVEREMGVFLASLARVELWLLGFDVEIGAPRPYPVFGFQARGPITPDRTLEAALRAFWDLLSNDKRRLSLFVTPELFQAFANPETAVLARDRERWDEPDYSRRVVERLTTTTDVSAAWAQGKSLGMRLWDGLTRVWRWIVRGVTAIVRVGQNLARAFFRFATKTFQIARTALKTVYECVKQYLDGEIVSGDDEDAEAGRSVRLLLSKDGDLVVYAPSAEDGGALTDATAALAYFGAGFHLSCRILGQLIRVIRGALVGTGLALVGWARLLWLLVRSYREIRPAYLELRALPRPDFLEA